ncbi:hypothetical protein [Kyrpidia tusciae]|uniref:Uncharacterized protein n=1 Tax=Kyrpidia tusciae (strain DSM 2912 / NBRC 15312 / T2) TaxID=562970 RepID=D5WPA1_KYRT2|nr:hypothetical protein [Kyrpidia tusciae]ADG06160.1 hypothetical protein Btus_1447 [Kyrpidia tusciae DSM 2912]
MQNKGKNRGKSWLWRFAILLFSCVLVQPSAEATHPDSPRIEIGDAGSGEILGRAPWDAEVAELVGEIARSCHQMDPAAQIRFPAGYIVRVVFDGAVEIGMPHPIRELWIVVPRGEPGSGRVIAFEPDDRMTVYRPESSLEPLRRWIHRHTGRNGAPVHRSESPPWTGPHR